MNTAGFIVLHRQILDWEWYQNANTFRLFVHLLLKANYEDGRFEGMVIKRGQLVTSLPSLSSEIQQSIQQVRTSLEHLKSTGEITASLHPKFQVITIVNYDRYQDKQQAKQQANNRQSTGNLTGKSTGNQQQYNNNNNINNINKGTNNYSCPTDEDIWFSEFWEAYPRHEAKKNALTAWGKLKVDPEMMGRIMTALRKQAGSEQWQREGGRYIPLPATWLNGRRWEDEFTASAPVAAPAPAQKRVLYGQDFEQRDYSNVDKEIMDDLAKKMKAYLERGEV